MAGFGYVEEDGLLIHRRKGHDDQIIPDNQWVKISAHGVQGSGKSSCLRALEAIARDSGAAVEYLADHELLIVHNASSLLNIRNF